MATISRIKPKDEGFIRIELEITHSDFIKVSYFKPQALLVKDSETKEVNFQMQPGRATTIGKYGITLPIVEDSNEKIVTIHQFESHTPEERMLATSVHLQENLTIVEKQVKDALKELTAAQETIKEV